MIPCKSCPWRVSTRTEDIPGGGMDEARATHTTAANAGRRDGRIMACHLTSDEKPHACAGWVERVGKPAAWASGEGAIPMRMMLVLGGVDLTEYSDGGADLYPTMDAMLSAHRRHPPDPQEDP